MSVRTAPSSFNHLTHLTPHPPSSCQPRERPPHFPQMTKPFYITTAIDYVNGQPHLGHAYEKVIADVAARARRSLGQEAFFLTGLDEHGQKVQQAAVTEGKSPQAYCDDFAQVWKAFAARLDLTNND